MPSYKVAPDADMKLLELLVASKIVTSKRQAREDLQNGAIYINGQRIQDVDYILSDADKIGEEVCVLRRGKKKYFLLQFTK